MVGSGAMFSDQYIDKEDNHKIKDVIFEFLTEGKQTAEFFKKYYKNPVRIFEYPREIK